MKKKLSGEEINEYIREHYLSHTDAEIATHCGLSENAIQCRRYAMKLKRPSTERPGPKPKSELTPEETVQAYTERKAGRQDKRAIQRLAEANAALQRTLDAQTTLASADIDTLAIAPEMPRKGVSHTGEATIVALLSDMHIEETVKPEMTNGLGGYSLEIAERRMQQYFETLLRLIEIEQSATRINNLVLALLGDAISGDIHEELLETCSLQPMDAALLVQNWIASGIQYLLDNSKLKICIVCHSGNHARTTKKARPATEPGHSIEYFMYQTLAKFFAAEKRLTWMIPRGYLSYVKVYDLTIAMHHGHNVKYQGGVGGITISMNKAIAQWNRATRADIYCCGHFHQVFDGGNFVVNGSMIGYNAFAVAIKAAYEKPAQVMFAVHSKRGKYMTRYILFD